MSEQTAQAPGTMPERSTARRQELVDRDTYISLLTARLPLVRCDDSNAGLRGLLDRENGRWYVIRQAMIEG